ncbi:hypothetical protein LXL04_003275 [Taraxacum kok-saghyz]
MGEFVGEGEETCRVLFDFMPSDACRFEYIKMDIRKHQDCVVQDGICHRRYCDRIPPSFCIGSRVEVVGLEPNFMCAFVGGKIKKVHAEGVDVQFDTIKRGNGRRFVGFVPYTRIRPYPLSWPTNYRPGDVVDVWNGEAWWPGVCIKWEINEYVVRYQNAEGSNVEVVFAKKDIRKNHLWSIINGWSCWMYSKAP